MVSLGKHGIQHIDVATESANIKLLKEKLQRKNYLQARDLSIMNYQFTKH